MKKSIQKKTESSNIVIPVTLTKEQAQTIRTNVKRFRLDLEEAIHAQVMAMFYALPGPGENEEKVDNLIGLLDDCNEFRSTGSWPSWENYIAEQRTKAQNSKDA